MNFFEWAIKGSAADETKPFKGFLVAVTLTQSVDENKLSFNYLDGFTSIPGADFQSVPIDSKKSYINITVEFVEPSTTMYDELTS